MNPIAGWLALIKTPSNAQKLLKLLRRMPEASYHDHLVLDQDGLPSINLRQRTPAMCPTQLLYGAKESEKLYLDPQFRPALDAWDNGTITREYLTKLCFQIVGGPNAQKR